MPFDTQLAPLARPALAEALRRAQGAIPPAWPLAATVAVNPFLGQGRPGEGGELGVEGHGAASLRRRGGPTSRGAAGRSAR